MCNSSFPFPAHVMYNLDEEESQGGIAINLLPILAKDIYNKTEQQSLNKKAQKSVIPLPSHICDSDLQFRFMPKICLSFYLVQASLSHVPISVFSSLETM